MSGILQDLPFGAWPLSPSMMLSFRLALCADGVLLRKGACGGRRGPMAGKLRRGQSGRPSTVGPASRQGLGSAAQGLRRGRRADARVCRSQDVHPPWQQLGRWGRSSPFRRKQKRQGNSRRGTWGALWQPWCWHSTWRPKARTSRCHHAGPGHTEPRGRGPCRHRTSQKPRPS